MKPLECSRLNAQNSSGGRGEFGGQECQKRQKDPKKKNRNVVIVQSGKNIVYLAGLVALPEQACVTETLRGLSPYLDRRLLPRPRRSVCLLLW